MGSAEPTAKDGGKTAGLEKGNLGQYLGSLPKRFAYLATDSDVEIAIAAERIGGGVSISVAFGYTLIQGISHA